MRRVLRGLLPAAGAIRLLLARGIALAAVSAVVFKVIQGAFVGDCGHGACGPTPGLLDAPGLASATAGGSATVIGVIAAAAALFWLIDQLLMAAALQTLDPRRTTKVAVWRGIRTGLTRHLLPMMRISLLGLVLVGLWTAAVMKGTEWMGPMMAREGWVATDRALQPVLRAALLSGGFAAVGAFTFWCKVLTVTDKRRRVRRTVFHAIRLAWRRPISGVLTSAVLAWMATLSTLPLTTLARPWVADTTATVAWAVALVGLFVIWYWRIHAAALVYGDEALKDLHGRSDAPFGLWGWVKGRWRRLRGLNPA